MNRAGVTKWLFDLIEGEAGGVPGDVNQVPAGVSYPDPYWVLRPVDGGGYSGPPLADPEADAVLVYQVDACGGRTDQVEKLQDRIRAAVTGRAGGSFVVAPAPPDGIVVVDRASQGSLAATPEGEPNQQAITQPERYEISVTPA